MAVEAVIFDFGGVFTTSPFEAFARLEAERGLPPGFLRGVNATNPDDNAWARFERAEVSAAGFDALFLAESAARGHGVPGADVMAVLAGQLRPRMVAALKACKQRFKVGCITNNMVHGVERPPEIAAVRALFDVTIESSKAGVRKPDPRIYLMMCEALGVAPGTCVYLDDLGVNCKPAAQLGMTAIKVLTEDQALADLSRATGLAFALETAA